MTPETLKDKRVLISGGSGFIGSHLARRMVQERAVVHILARQESTCWRIDNIKDSVSIHRAELNDMEGLRAIVAAAKPEYVFHVAGNSRVRRLEGDLAQLDESLDVNVRGTLNLLRALYIENAKLRVFLRAAGLEEYGRGPVPYVETQREEPVSPYSASQVAITQYVQMLRDTLPFPVVSLRFALVYGPAQSMDFMVPTLIEHCFRGEDLEMSSGEQTRDWIYVDDVVDAALCAAVTPASYGEIINIGSGQEIKVHDFARLVVDLAGAKIELHLGRRRTRLSEIQRLWCSIEKTRKLLDWIPQTSPEEGLKKTIAWYREHSPKVAKEM